MGAILFGETVLTIIRGLGSRFAYSCFDNVEEASLEDEEAMEFGGEESVV